MKCEAVSGLLAVLLVLPCLVASATSKLGDLTNQLDTVLRFVEGKEREETRRPQSIVSEDHSEAPAFCNKLDCPDFTVVKNESTFQLREYKVSRWVSTTSVDIDFDTAQEDNFMRLFDYISGKNEKKEKIAMTAPVTTRIIPGQGPACANNFTMSFYMAPKVAEPPKPSDEKVFLSGLPKVRIYVRSFGGFASKAKWLSEAQQLEADLDKASYAYTTDHYYIAGYDSPFKLFNRHNEVWFLAA